MKSNNKKQSNKTLITAIDYSKTPYSILKKYPTKHKREVYSIISIEENNLNKIKKIFKNLKHTRKLKSDTEKRTYLKRFVKNFNKDIFFYVDFSETKEEIILKFNNVKNETKLLIIDDYLFQ